MLCFRKILVAKRFMDKREVQVSKFFSKIFGLKGPQNAVGEPFSLPLMSGIGKVQMRGRGVLSSFSIENFLSHSAEKIPRATLYDINIFEYRKFFMLQRVMSRFSFEFFCLTVPKDFVEEPFCAVFQKISGSQKFMHKKGDIQGLRSKISCLTVPKTYVEQPDRVSLILGMENFHASEGCVRIFCQKFPSHSAEKTS